MQSTSEKPEGRRVQGEARVGGTGPGTLVLETSKLNILGRAVPREGGRGPEREVWESWRNTIVGGKEPIVKKRLVLL